MSGENYRIDLETVLGGVFSYVLGKHPDATFVSFEHADEYCQCLVHAIRAGGDDCTVVMDRYHTQEAMARYNNMVEMGTGGYYLVYGLGRDDIIDLFFGSIPVPVIRYMEDAEAHLSF